MEEELRMEKYIADILEMGLKLKQMRKRLRCILKKAPREETILYFFYQSRIPDEIEKIRRLVLSEIEKLEE